MKLRRYFLIGICGTVIGLIALIILALQFILLNNYQRLEAQDAKANMQRVLDTFQNNIDSFKISDTNWNAPPAPRPLASGGERGGVDLRLIEKISFDTGAIVTMLIDRDNKVVFNTVSSIDSEKSTSSIPTTVLDSPQPDNPFVGSRNLQRMVKGLVTLPEGPLMMISLPLPAGAGRIIWGRYFDEAEIQRLSDITHLDIGAVTYDENLAPADFQRAKVNLTNGDDLYIESQNDQTLSGYTLMNDVFGEPSIILRIQIPRTIYQVGQSGLVNFALVLTLSMIGIGAAAYLLLEHVILSPLTTLTANLNSTQPRSVPAYNIDEFNKIATGFQTLNTSRLAVESKLQEANDKLESRVTERTSELFTINANLQQQLDTNKQVQSNLVDARDKALEALQVRSQLLANVSHDARTPLTIIGLNTEMLQRGKHGDLNAKQVEVLDRILIASRQILNFMTNMLGQSQLVNSKIQLVKVVFEPKLLVEDLVSMLIPLADSKGIALRSEVDLALPLNLMGDPERLKQIITNLCENALKFTKEGEVVVKALRKDQYNWVIHVKDTGCGIPLEAQTRIFEAYWQLENELPPNPSRGIGLGLSIVRQIVQLMNGTISVDSELGRGTTFTVTLPIEIEPVRLTPETVEKITGPVTRLPNNTDLESTQTH